MISPRILLSVIFHTALVINNARAFKITDYMSDIKTASEFDTSASPTEVILKYGYTAETHIVQSADGYLLEMHRIPYGKQGPKAINPYPVLLHHGILCTSLDWIMYGPNRSLAFSLADAGYDVWLANVRGNTFSRRHISLNSSQNEFWNFSFHESGYYDTPAMIDYILSRAKAEKLVYVGHSQGTTIFFVMTSTRPEYNKKIKMQISLAPATTLTHTKTPMRYLIPFAEKFYSSVPMVTKDNLGGTSGKNMIHSSQLVSPGIFAQYDYGSTGNVEHYNSVTPPPYNLSLISAPIAVYYAENDIITDPLDVKLLYQQLPNPIALKPINDDKFEHMDFLRSEQVNRLLNEELVQFVENATSHSDSDHFIEEKMVEGREIRDKTPPPVDVPYESSSNTSGIFSALNLTDLNLEKYKSMLQGEVLDSVHSVQGAVFKTVNTVNEAVQGVIGNVLKTEKSIRTGTENSSDAVNQAIRDNVAIVANTVEKSVATIEREVMSTLERLLTR